MAKITRAAAQKMLADVPADKLFWCRDGREFKNLQELSAAFQEMSDVTFRYHANEQKNDFSNWVKDVIGDEQLAQELSKCSNRNKAAKVVNKRIAVLKKAK